MRNNGVWSRDIDDDSSIDTILTPVEPSCHEVMKAAGHNWSLMMSDDKKQAWKDRAEVLNNRPKTDGTFDCVPLEIYHAELDKAILVSLTMEWINFTKVLKGCIVRNVKGNLAANLGLSYKFGKERIELFSQCYKSFTLNNLLKLTIFGSPLFSKLRPYELVYRGKKESVVHWFSYRRMSDLLCFGGLDAVSIYSKNGCVHKLCGKANLKKDGKNVVGYIMDENDEVLKVIVPGTGGNELIDVTRPVYDCDNGEYIYPHSQTCDSYSLSEVWPIRIRLNTVSGSIAIITSSATFDEDNVIVN